MKIYIFIVLFSQFLFANDTYYYKKNTKIDLIYTKSIYRDLSSIDYYKTKNNILLGVSNSILVKITNKISIDDIAQDFNLTVKQKFTDNLYLVEVKNKNLTLDIANKLNNLSYIKYAQPNFLKHLGKR